MSLAIVNARASVGIAAPPVTVEVHLTNGLPGLAIVGLPEAAVREMARVLRPGGRLLLTVPFSQPLHELPSDYWRFTPSALRLLAEESGLEIERIDDGERRPPPPFQPGALPRQLEALGRFVHDNTEWWARISHEKRAQVNTFPDDGGGLGDVSAGSQKY